MILLSAKASEPAVETVTETAKKDKYKQNVGLKKKKERKKRGCGLALLIQRNRHSSLNQHWRFLKGGIKNETGISACTFLKSSSDRSFVLFFLSRYQSGSKGGKTKSLHHLSSWKTIPCLKSHFPGVALNSTSAAEQSRILGNCESLLHEMKLS